MINYSESKRYIRNLFGCSLQVVFFLISISCSHNKIQISSLYCENKINPSGVDTTDLRFSWKISSPGRNILQTAYRVIVATGENGSFKSENIIWDSGIRESDQSILNNYGGPGLNPGTTYRWKVKVWDNQGNESGWSNTGQFTTGLFSIDDWSDAKWIAYDGLDPAHRIVPGIHLPSGNAEWKKKPSGEHVLPILRKEFNVKGPVKHALVFVSGLGHYELHLNGIKVGDRILAPGWTDYDDYCFYNIYDITEDIVRGGNTIGMMLGNGFYIVPNSRYRKLITAYGNPKMILKLQLLYKDGSSDIVVSDESWKTDAGPVTYSSIFGGENYNATFEQQGWDLPGFDDSSWRNAILVQAPDKKLMAEQDYPVKKHEVFEAKTISCIDQAGKYLYDFGQNASGIIEIRVRGHRGDTVRLIPAELIRDNFTAEQKATGSPYYFMYVLKGDGIETWSPRFTYYGFRYVQTEGAVPDSTAGSSGLPEIISLKLVHTRNSSPKAGNFYTSFDLFNRINSLILWAINSNLQSVVTDCPHREKLGWLEQTHLMGGSIHYNYDVYHLYCKLIDDMISAQTEAGLVPDIAPEYTEFAGGFRDSPEWGSASVILPWLIYQWYGDTSQIEKAWDMMSRYVDYLKEKSENNILSHGLGDWYDLGPDLPGFSQLTPVALTATAIWYYDIELMVRMAHILGKTKEAKRYEALALEVKDAFNEKFFDPEFKVYATGSQTAMSMPLVLGLVDEHVREKVFNNLVDSIHATGNALTAGDIGFHYLVKALQDGEAGDLLYQMNARDDVPGYGYQLKKGATALTESWAALERVSNNHLMLGHIMEWFYGGLAGIGQTGESAAYKEIIIEPQIINDIDKVAADFESPYGTIASQWQKTDNGILLQVSIPVNTTAIIILPAGEANNIREGGKLLRDVEGLDVLEEKGSKVFIQAGSGEYKFDIKKLKE